MSASETSLSAQLSMMFSNSVLASYLIKIFTFPILGRKMETILSCSFRLLVFCTLFAARVFYNGVLELRYWFNYGFENLHINISYFVRHCPFYVI